MGCRWARRRLGRLGRVTLGTPPARADWLWKVLFAHKSIANEKYESRLSDDSVADLVRMSVFLWHRRETIGRPSPKYEKKVSMRDLMTLQLCKDPVMGELQWIALFIEVDHGREYKGDQSLLLFSAEIDDLLELFGIDLPRSL